jgi:hypothetical protein
MENVQLNLITDRAAILSNLRPGGYHEQGLQIKHYYFSLLSWS